MVSSVIQRQDQFYRNHKIRDAIGEAIYREMEANPAIYLFGEGAWVKQFYDAPRIYKTFADRIVTLPICEDGSVNFAVGASLLGITAVVDVITADFLYRAMDSICNTAAKLSFLRDTPSTIVIRAEFLTGGPTTGQRPEALFTHIPGLDVIIPSTPRDAYGLMRTALNAPGVTLFFEDRMIRDDLHQETDCRLTEQIGVGYSLVRRSGNVKPDCTVVTYGLMRQMVEQALDPMLNIDLIDLRSIYPLHWMGIAASTRRSKKLLIIEPDIQYGGVGAEIAATIAEKQPDVRVKRLGGWRAVIPAAVEHHQRIIPNEEQIVHAVANW